MPTMNATPIPSLPIAWWLAYAITLLVTATAGAADAPEQSEAEQSEAEQSEAEPASSHVSYHRQIRPILQANCQGCHQPAKRGGEYVMTDFDKLLAGGESGEAAIVPGDVEASYLVTQIEPFDDFAVMPQDAPPLADAEIELIKAWIEQGAEDDTPADDATRHDMNRPPQYATAPIITSLDFSPDGAWLAVAGYHEVLLHKADGSELVMRLVGLSPRIESVRFSPDGRRLAVTGGDPGRAGEVQIWDTAQRALVLSLPVTHDSIYGASWSPDGKRLAFGCGDETVRAVNAESGEEVLLSDSPSDWALGTVFSTEGTHVVAVSRDRTAKLIDLESQQLVDNITSIDSGRREGGLMAVARHPAKDEVIIGGADGQPRSYRILPGDRERKIRDYAALPGRVTAVAYHPKGARIVVASSNGGNGEVRVYDAANGEPVWKHATAPLYTVAYAPDGKTIAAAGFDGNVYLFDADTGKVRHQFVPVPLN